MKEIERARSIYERAIDVDHRCIQVWLRYAEMEMRNKQVNHARNVWDRAVTLLPRAQQLWYKYAYMEEVLQNITACRAVFERWMEWEPDPQAWHSYINFEYRYKVFSLFSLRKQGFLGIRSSPRRVRAIHPLPPGCQELDEIRQVGRTTRRG